MHIRTLFTVDLITEARFYEPLRTVEAQALDMKACNDWSLHQSHCTDHTVLLYCRRTLILFWW